MIPQIGHVYRQIAAEPDAPLVHVQDRDNLNKVAKVGVPDANGIIWESQWVSWDDLAAVEPEVSPSP